MTSLERIDLNLDPWDAMDSFEDRTIMQRRPWLDYIIATHKGEPVIAAVKEYGKIVGYFTGLIVNKYGVRILGSPFKGWASAYMGFNLPPGQGRRDVLKILPAFAFNELRCHYLELIDRYVRDDDYMGLGYSGQMSQGYEIDLTRSEDELLAGMNKRGCHRAIRKAQKTGVVIEEASDSAFADDYFDQLKDVFLKQSLTPPHGIERVQQLIKHIYPTGNLLLLRARNPEGICIATGIFPAFNGTAYYWGAASWRQYQSLRPNEALFWHAMRYWKARGVKIFDMGGGGDYKRKYGCYEICVPRIMKGKYGVLVPMRDLAKRIYGVRQRISGCLIRPLSGRAP